MEDQLEELARRRLCNDRATATRHCRAGKQEIARFYLSFDPNLVL
jgi:hypothetical protein